MRKKGLDKQSLARRSHHFPLSFDVAFEMAEPEEDATTPHGQSNDHNYWKTTNGR
jgi:hypothetical protein